MRIEHIAIWTRHLEEMREFYEKYFEATANRKYMHQHDSYASYFLNFADGARLELMYRDDLADRPLTGDTRVVGLTHLAIKVESEAAVDSLAKRLAGDGYNLAKQPGRTGDGYYECSVCDPDGNLVEITA